MRIFKEIPFEEPLFSTEQLRKLFIPLIIERFLVLAVGLMDSIMVGSVGEAAVSGVSLVDDMSNIVINLFGALATGGGVIVAQFLGAKNREHANRAAGQLIISSVLLALIIMTVLLLFNPGIITFCFGAVSADVLGHASTYLLYMAISYPFLALYSVSAALFRCMGNSKISMRVSLISNALNLVGNTIFIFGFSMGVAGAALSTLISRIVAAVIITLPLTDPLKPISVHTLSDLTPRPRVIGDILRIGIPTGIENTLFHLGRIVLTGLIVSFGPAQLAAYSASGKILSLNNLVSSAFGLCMIPVVGTCIGAGKFDQARYYAKRLLRTAQLLSIPPSIILALLLPGISALYRLSPETSQWLFMLSIPSFIISPYLHSASFAFPHALRAVNDTSFTMVVSFSSMAFVRILLAFFLGKGLGIGTNGVMIAMYLDWGVRALCFQLRFRSKAWETRAKLT